MCNSSFQINQTAFIFGESMDWLCMCNGHFGPLFTYLTSILFFVVGTPLHVWSLRIILHGNVTSNMVFPLNTTVLELFFCFQAIIDIFAISFPSVAVDRFANFLIGLSWTFRPLIQSCMCVEQYVAVIHPVTFLKYKGIQYRIGLVVVAGVVALGNSLRLIFTGTSYFNDSLFFFAFCFTVTVISFCCASVLHALTRPGPADRNSAEIDRRKTVGNKQKRKAFRIISHILVSILVCYLPLVVIYFLNTAEVEKHFYLCEIVPLTLSFTMTVILISPLVRMHSEGHLNVRMWFSKFSATNK